jgi:hypothetical protein
MAASTIHQHRPTGPFTFVTRAAIVALTIGTAAIHASLGGTLFMLNAAVYAAFAVAMVLPGPVARIRWLVRYALIGFTITTILGWVAVGARFDLAYIDKALEIALVGLLLLDSWAVDGGPLAVARRAQRMAESALR